MLISVLNRARMRGFSWGQSLAPTRTVLFGTLAYISKINHRLKMNEKDLELTLRLERLLKIITSALIRRHFVQQVLYSPVPFPLRSFLLPGHSHSASPARIWHWFRNISKSEVLYLRLFFFSFLWSRLSGLKNEGFFGKPVGTDLHWIQKFFL